MAIGMEGSSRSPIDYPTSHASLVYAKKYRIIPHLLWSTWFTSIFESFRVSSSFSSTSKKGKRKRHTLIGGPICRSARFMLGDHRLQVSYLIRVSSMVPGTQAQVWSRLWVVFLLVSLSVIYPHPNIVA